MAAPDPHTALYTTVAVRTLDRAAIASGIAGIELMQRAAQAVFAELRRRWPEARSVCVLCGPGNNGGDGFLVAALARAAGLQVSVLALSDHSTGDAGLARENVSCVKAARWRPPARRCRRPTCSSMRCLVPA